MGALNKVIEQIAYKQVEDMIVYLEMLDEQLIKTSKTAKDNAKNFSMLSTSNSDLNKKLLESQAIIKQLQKDYQENKDALEKLTKKVEEHAKAKAKMTQEGRNAIIDAREERKVLDGNAVANSSLTSYIQKLSVERAKAARTVADYNAQIKMGITLTDQQNQELVEAEKVFKKYDNAIKAGKQSVGDYRERVGQYERANVGLKNSINQITRELPAATFGFQTFALGISNNVPILVDEINQLTEVMRQNAAQSAALADEKALAEQVLADAQTASEASTQAQTIAETALAEAENIATVAAERQALAAEALTVAQGSATATSQTQALAEAELTAATLAADAALELQIIAESELTAASAAATAASQRLTVAEAELAAATTAANASQAATPSILSRVGSALFSFNTLMTVGLLLLALYGKEISNWFTELFKGEQQLNDATKALIEFQNAQSKGIEYTKNELQIYKEYLEIASGVTGDKTKQKIAIDKLRSTYPAYLKALTDEQIIKLKGSKIDQEIKKVLGAGEQYKTHLQEVKNVNERIEAYRLEIKERSKYKAALDDQYKILSKNSIQIENGLQKENKKRDAAIQEIALIHEREKLRKESLKDEVIQTATTNQLQNSLIQLNKVYKNSLEDSQELKNESILLEYTDTDAKDKNTKSIKLNTKAREDYLASEYELWKLRKTNETNLNKEIMEDEASGYDLRLLASEQYYENQLDLANREAKEELRILNFATEDKLRTSQNEYLNQKEQLDTYLSDGKISRQKYNKAIKDAEEQLQYDRSGILKDASNNQNIIYENQAQRLIDINKELVGVMQKAYDEINFQKADIEIAEVDLKGIEKIKEILSGVQDGLSVKEIDAKLKEVSKLVAQSTADVNLREAQLELDRKLRDRERLEREIKINGEINNLSKEQIDNQIFNNKALLDLDEEIIKSKKKVLEADNQVKNAEIDNIKELQQAKEDYNNAVLEGASRLNSDVSDLANQLFDNSITKYDLEIEKSNEYYDSLLANAENGSEQEQLLLEEKARKEEELQRKRVALQRKQAMFNKIMALAEVGINLAQEISKNAAMTGTIGAALLTPIAIASAAVRTATILATPLPQYEKGRLGGPEETALINEKRIEPVESKDGSVKVYSGKNRIVNLKAGDIVHKSVEDFQKNKLNLESASIMASFVNQSNQLKAFDYYIGKELNGLSGKIEKGIEKGFKKAKINNNNVNNVYIGRKPSNFFN